DHRHHDHGEELRRDRTRGQSPREMAQVAERNRIEILVAAAGHPDRDRDDRDGDYEQRERGDGAGNDNVAHDRETTPGWPYCKKTHTSRARSGKGNFPAAV